MLVILAALGAVQAGGPSIHQSDTAPLLDRKRTVAEISRTGFSLQYATAAPCETKVEVRQGESFNVLTREGPVAYRMVAKGGVGLWHTLNVTGLAPGKRYYYRLYDPGAEPTHTETVWGAAAPWSREYAVSTEAPAGRQTIVHLPVKVLLMPNVVNAVSAVQPDGSIAPDPPRITPAQITMIENEFRLASRVFWCNSGMRLWVDFKFFVDDRWQRWGPEAESATPFFQNLPLCRSYGGKHFIPPGGGTFTIVDTQNLIKSANAPVRDGYACQVEMAWPRRWDPVRRTWNFYTSGGGTLGADELPAGVPARTQFLAGGDTAWLAEHEIHHQLESLGSLCLGNSEDDRIVSDHPSPRRRNRRGDGTYDEQDWTTAGPHGERWDVMRYWDRRVTDCQWLRFGFGITETVVDKNGDGFPDSDPRLPLDASRFKAFAGTSSYAAACTRDWVRLPLQPSWIKDRGTLNGHKAPPTAGNQGVIVPFHPPAQADPAPWSAVPTSLVVHGPTLDVSFKHSYDEAGYYGLLVARGDTDHIDIDLDGEGKGMFTPPGALGFSIISLTPAPGQAGPMVLPVSVKPTFGGVRGQAPWLTWKAVRKGDGTLVFEFKIPNGGDGPWYWHGAGHEVGIAINAYDTQGRGYSAGEPYRLYYSRMAETRGSAVWPPVPGPLASEPTRLKVGAKGLSLGPGWSLEGDGNYRHIGPAGALIVGAVRAVQFDLVADVRFTGAFGVGAYAPLTPRPDADRDYTAVVNQGQATLHVNGTAGDPAVVQNSSDTHTIELRRRRGGDWLLVDGQVRGYAWDRNPRVVLNRFAVLAGPDSIVEVRTLTYREAQAS
ncbi:MAG: hypothetical protein ACYC96_02035 [Fimbriimonadaceae bacterium]